MMNQEKESWQCPNGCVGMCEHLEKLMPKPSNQSVRCIFNNYLTQKATGGVAFKCAEEIFRDDLKEHGFVSELDLDLLVAVYVQGLTIAEITEEFKWVSVATAGYYLRKLKRLLRERYA